jgi:hypothetical protein
VERRGLDVADVARRGARQGRPGAWKSGSVVPVPGSVAWKRESVAPTPDFVAWIAGIVSPPPQSGELALEVVAPTPDQVAMARGTPRGRAVPVAHPAPRRPTHPASVEWRARRGPPNPRFSPMPGTAGRAHARPDGRHTRPHALRGGTVAPTAPPVAPTAPAVAPTERTVASSGDVDAVPSRAAPQGNHVDPLVIHEYRWSALPAAGQRRPPLVIPDLRARSLERMLDAPLPPG